MPESGLKPRDGSPNMSQMPLAAPNSPARRGSARSGGALLEPYHDIASTFFSMGQAGDLDDVFLIASRVSFLFFQNICFHCYLRQFKVSSFFYMVQMYMI